MAISEDRDEDRPVSGRAALLSELLGFAALLALAAGAWGAALQIISSIPGERINWGAWVVYAVMLLVGGAAAWGSARLKPWSRYDPVSPATKKRNTLFRVSGILAVIASMAVAFDAIFAIAFWLLSCAIACRWYVSADELEQRASDVGLLLGGFLFAVVTPAWWVAARAGLLPQPNAIVLWFAVNVIWTAGWFWRRNR